MSDTQDTASFNKNYKVLKDTADWLSQQKEPDIDQLVPKVESAMQAYKVCKTRLDAVQATLSQYFEPDGTTATEEAPAANGNGSPRTNRPTPPSDSSDDEDGTDIPF
jgi:exodeoxyribonuclease VII small subunit